MDVDAIVNMCLVKQLDSQTGQQQPHSRPGVGKDEGLRILKHDGAVVFANVLQPSGDTQKATF